MNRLRFISRVVYRLKRRYGEPAHIVERTGSVVNLETGAKTVSKRSLYVNRVIVLPSKIHREFQYDLTFIATNKNFTYGGLYDTTEREFIIDRKDLPDFEIKVGMYLLFKDRRYEVKEVAEFEDNTAYVILGKQCLEAHAETVIDVTVGNTIDAISGSENTP